MWWMWHGDNGHWVINKTPGSHGGDRMKSVMGDFDCPQDKTEWEGEASGDRFVIKSNPCCEHVHWTGKGGKDLVFTRTDEMNEEYPVYRVGDIAMWWMWHGPVGHWVVNR